MDNELDTAALDRMIDKYTSQKRLLEAEIESMQFQVDELDSLISGLVDVKKSVEKMGPLPLVAAKDESVEDEPQKTNFERIVEYLHARKVPMTIAQIEEGTGIPRSSVSAVLYRTHGQHFIAREHSGNKPNTWQLADAYDPSDQAPEGDVIPF